jgi:hypothetical protein
MASSLFAGDPLKAPSYAATTSDVPQWLQDYTVDLFSQQRAVAGTPYQPYQLPRIADVTAPTTAAQNLITSSSGAYQPAMQNAIAGTQGLTGQQAGVTSGLGMLQQAAGMSGIGAAQPLFNQAVNLTGQAGATNTAAALEAGQAQYTNPALMTQNLNQGQASLARAGQQDVMAAANPYLQAAGQTATSNIGAYMNPYTQSVTDQIAKLGARNLSENLLPAVSDQFIRAGQFGSSGMGTFGQRALRDTQESILANQAAALQTGYGQALGASQADLSRQGQLATTAGQLTGQQAQNLANLGQTYTQAGQAQQTTGLTAEQATAQAQQADAQRQLAAAGQLGTIGQQTGALTQAGQQNLGTIGAQTAATAQAEAARQAQTQQQVADLAKMQQGLTTADAAALEAVGSAQQAQTQKGLDVAYQDYQNQINFPQQQINNMSATLRGLPATAVPTTGTQTGYTTQFAPSPLSTIAAAYGTYKGLTTQAKGGLIDGYAEGGAVTGNDDLYGSVMADYGQYLTKHYDEKMANVQPALQQNKNAVANMAAYHSANAPIASPNTVPAMYKQYNTLKSSLNPGAVDEASAAVNALQAKYNEGFNALNPSAVTAAADAANAMVKPYSDPATILSAYNSGAYDVGMPKDITPAERRAMIDQYVASGYTTVAGPDPTIWWMRPKAVPSTGVLPTAKQAEYDALLNNYNTLNSNYTTGLEKLAPTKSEYDAMLAKYNDLNTAYTAGTDKLASQKAAYEKALKASQIPSPFGNSMPRLAHGGMVPGYAEEGYVDTENPADLVDGGQAFADQYAAMQQQYPTQQDMPMAAMPTMSYTQDPEVARANAERKALLKQLQESLTKAPASTDYGPSESEKWLNFAAAFSDPGKTGSFGEGMGRAASSLAAHKADQRKARALNAAADLQRLQSRSALAQQQYEMERDEGKRRMIEQYLTPKPTSTEGATVGGQGAGADVPDNMKALLLSLDADEAVKTLVDMAKEQNKPSDLIRGVKFLVGSGAITKEQGNAIVQENLQGKLEMIDVTIPELGGTFKLTGPEARKFYDSNVLPARFAQTAAPAGAPAQAAAPGGAPAQATSRQLPPSQEQMKAKETGLVEQSKADIAASGDLLAQKSFAKQQKDAANLVLGYATKSPKSFGVLADPTFSNALANLVDTGVNTPWGSVGLAVEEPIAKLKLTGPEASVRQLAAAPIALIEVGYRKMFLKGEGAVSNMEGALTKYIGPQLSDSAKTVQLKAGMITIGAEKQEKIVDAFEKYKEQHPEAGPRSFYQTPEYKRINDNYETKYRTFAEKNGIPVAASTSGGSLAERIRQERTNRQNKEGK